MTGTDNSEFLNFIWTNALYSNNDALSTTDGRRVFVISHGQQDINCSCGVLSIRINIDGVETRGGGVVLERSSDWSRLELSMDQRFDDAIIAIVAHDDATPCHRDGSPIPTVVIEVPKELAEKYRTISSAGSPFACSNELSMMEPLYVNHILTRLAIERLERKYNDFDNLRIKSHGSWSEAFYITLFKTMGRGKNQEQYMKLAGLAPYVNICRIKNSILSVEAMLLGTAGFLWPDEKDFFPDEYTLSLQREFNHLSLRFDIKPMRPEEWNLKNNNPNNHPVIRIVQLAAILQSKEFLYDKLMLVKTLEEAKSILDARASEYWTTHYLPGKISGYSSKHIGDDTLDSLTINLVIPMMFTYGRISRREEFQEKAMELLEKIPAEVNSFTNQWKSKCKRERIENAFFSQAVIQLGKEYCLKGNCVRCSFGRILLGE